MLPGPYLPPRPPFASSTSITPTKSAPTKSVPPSSPAASTATWSCARAVGTSCARRWPATSSVRAKENSLVLGLLLLQSIDLVLFFCPSFRFMLLHALLASCHIFTFIRLESHLKFSLRSGHQNINRTAHQVGY